MAFSGRWHFSATAWSGRVPSRRNSSGVQEHLVGGPDPRIPQVSARKIARWIQNAPTSRQRLHPASPRVIGPPRRSKTSCQDQTEKCSIETAGFPPRLHCTRFAWRLLFSNIFIQKTQTSIL
jgi:hypothetical protein